MKLITVHYLGFTAMDRRFSSPMLPWIVSEIKKRDSTEQVCLGAEDGTLQAYNTDFELQFSHRIQDITRFSQADTDLCAFLYLLRDDTHKLLYCYLFQALRPSDVTDLWHQMREHGTTPTHLRSASLSGISNLTSLCLDISPSSSHFFEVLYIGKIKVSHKKVPETFIDDALDKFKAHELEKGRSKKEPHAPPAVYEVLRRGSQDSTASESSSWDSITLAHTSSTDTDHKSTDTICNESSTNAEHSPSECSADPVKVRCTEQHNRTMVLQVGRTDLRLISPDRKLVLLHKQHRDVVSCVQGSRNPEHFGFVCREGAHHQQSASQSSQPHQPHVAAYVGYIFKCESTSVTADAVAAISQASTTGPPNNQKSHSALVQRAALTSCEHCPMMWYHRLCAEVEGLSERKTQAAIYRRIDQLDDDEQTIILTKFRGAETDSIRDQNEFLMMLLRAHCEMKQNRHVHDTAENRSEFLNQYLGGGAPTASTIFMKARRSLSNSFDHLLKRKGSRDDIGAQLRDLTLPLSGSGGEGSGSESKEGEGSGGRTRSYTIGSQSDLKDLKLHDMQTDGEASLVAPEKNLKSPMMDIFMKVGNSPKSGCASSESSPQKSDVSGSWRQAIFNRVVTPNKNATSDIDPEKKRTPDELRALWRKSIHQAVLLVRMEKENAKLKARQEETAVKRIKLEYDELSTCQREVVEVWELLVSKESRVSIKCDNQMLRQAIRQGVPRGKRGEVWQFLAEQHQLGQAPVDATKFPNYHVPYEQLLKKLTSHQHAILIDLGRTFPNHPYFSSPLGPGQLALFNLLKAYSLLDPEVGYCQGLSFVAGVLLLHMDESDAFRLLRHLMFVRGLRSQYLPDMVALQVRLYQLSRLLHDRLPDLYAHLDSHEAAPTLYAAPWLLTLFASQFPLGFVARVFDLLFAESTDVVFRVALALLSHHREQLLACDSFEEIMEYLKNGVPFIDKPQLLDGLMRQVYAYGDAAKQLNEYRVEYHVLQEEAASSRPQVEELQRLRGQTATLADQNRTLGAQLEIALSNVQRLERTRAMQQATINRLEMQCRGLEVSVVTLGTFIDDLVERRKLDVQVPGDVRRIVSQLMHSERRKSEQIPSTTSTLAKTISNGAQLFRRPSPGPGGRIMVKSLSTGRLAVSSTNNDATARSTSLTSQNELEKNLKNTNLAQSVMTLPDKGFPLRVLDDDDKPYTAVKSMSNPNLGSKVSNFFSNSHSHILQQHRHGASGDVTPPLRSPVSSTIKQIIREDSRENLQQYADRSGSISQDVLDTNTDDKSSIQCPSDKKLEAVVSEKVSPTSSVDSGVGTPVSPASTDCTDSSSLAVHPLSACDVNFTFNGTTKLKTIRSIRNLSRNSSPDLLGK